MRQMLKSPAVQAALRAEANIKAARLRSVVPVDTGKLRDSITVEMDETRSRARARVVMNTPYAAVVAATSPQIASVLDK